MSEDANKAKFIIEVKQYRDQDGRSVTEHIPYGSDPLPEDFPRFMGHVTVQARRGPMTEGHPLQFQIHADSVERAFALFDGVAQATVQDLSARMNAPRAASPEEQRRILGPDGGLMT